MHKCLFCYKMFICIVSSSDFENDTPYDRNANHLFCIISFHMHACAFHDAVMQLLSICIKGLKDVYNTVLKSDPIWCIYGDIWIQMHELMHDACVGVCIFLMLAFCM